MELTFITYEHALEILRNNKSKFESVSIPLENSGGQILAEHLIADRDFPPYHRVTMDGIAIRHRTFENGIIHFPIQEVAAAGAPQKTLLSVDHCIEVMTGSILPKQTDTVIRYEELTIKDGIATIDVEQVTKRQNIHFKGIDITAGTIVKHAGTPISSAEINVAAAIGKHEILVQKLPEIVIISTGDELVDVQEIPLEHQIRRSNVYGIQNTLREWGLEATLSHLPDDKSQMKEIIASLLHDFDVLIFTGGVSKGKFDFLPDVLLELGVKKHFHKIQQRPGKPIWFGTKEETTIFGLPGNPVSSFVCLYAYIRYWLIHSIGMQENVLYARLTEDIQFRPNLIYFTEAKLTCDSSGQLNARPIFGNGSGDFVNLVETDGFLILPQEKQIFKKGETYPFIPYRTKL